MSTAALVSLNGFDVQTGYYCRSSWTSSCERRAPFDQDSTARYQTQQAASAFQSCLCFSATLGAWCVQSASVCCSWTILNVKYYWKMAFLKNGVLFFAHKSQKSICRSNICVSVGPWCRSLFNEVSSSLFLLSQCSHLCIPHAPVYIQIRKDSQIKGSLRPCFILGQKKLSGNVEVLDRDKTRCRPEIGPFFFLQLQKFSFKLGRLCLQVTPRAAVQVSRC